jgi:predicted transposase/invertase (TIGR01784 family)
VIPGIDPRVDYAFKRVFGSPENEAVLVAMLNDVLTLEGAARVARATILNPFNEKEIADDKLSVLDIKAQDQSGRQFVVEMQLILPPGIKQRIMYYWARSFSSQAKEGDEYVSLKPTIALCFLNRNLFVHSERWHHRFRFLEETCLEPFSDDIQLDIVELAKVQGQVPSSSDGPLKWACFLNEAENLDTDKLPDYLDTPEMRQAMSTLQSISESERQHQLYESRLKARLDAAWMAKYKQQLDEEARQLKELREKLYQEAEEAREAAHQEAEAAHQEAEAAHQEAEAAHQEAEAARQQTQLLLIDQVLRLQRLLKQQAHDRTVLERLSTDELRALIDGLEQAF